MKNSRLLAILAVLFSVVVWGISFVSTKVILLELPPISIAYFRQIIAIFPLLLMMKRNDERMKIERKDILLFFIVSLFGIVLYFVFENSGLQYTTANNASMLVAAIPVFALLIDSFISKKKLHLLTFVLVLLSMGGVYLVLFDDGMPDFSSKTFLGNMLVFAAMLTWIAYTFLSRRLGLKYSSLKLTTILTSCSLLLYIPFVIHEVPLWKIPSTSALLHLLFLGILCSAAAFMAYLYGLQVLGPVIPSAFLNLIPVVTIITSAIILFETPTWVQVIGTVLIIGSLSYLTWSGRNSAIKEVSSNKGWKNGLPRGPKKSSRSSL